MALMLTKRLFGIVILVSLCDRAWSSDCPEISYTLTSQAEVVALGETGCTRIRGSLTVREGEAGAITTLDPLSNLLRVDGSLFVTNNSAITNLDGLVNLGILGPREEWTGPVYYPAGPQTNVAYSTVTGGGWELCHSSRYDSRYYQGDIAESCGVGEYSSLMMACRRTGSSTIQLLAAAPATDVLMATSSRTDTHIANGTAWYNYSGYSSGFARAGDQILLNSADTNTSGSNDQRLSWHWNSSGWRCGIDRWGSTSNLERLVFANGPPPGHLTVNNNASLRDIEGLRSLTQVVGDVGVSSNPDLINVDGLRGLTSIEGSLNIASNDVLEDLDGLRNLTRTEGNVTINNNDLITELDGLVSLAEVGGNLTIESNDRLYDLQGLNNLGSLAGTLTFSSNPALSKIDGFEQLASLGGSLSVTSNSALQSLEGFNSIETIGGTLSIYNNEQLLGMSLKGFGQLSTVGSLSVRDNDSLEHLDGLRALEIISGSLEVYSNWRLGSCKALAYVLELGSVGGGISIRNNPSNCSSRSQILSSISPPSQPEIIEAVSVNRSPTLKLTPSQSAEPLWPLTGYEAACNGVTVRKSVQSGAVLSDNSPVTQRVTVSSEAVLSAIEVDVDISHSDPSDLVVTLTSPAGTEEVLWAQQATMGEDLVVTFGSGVPSEQDDSSGPAYYPVGPQTNVAYSTVIDGGWELCHSSRYDSGYYQGDIAESCGVGEDSSLMMACRRTGRSTIQLLAAGPATDVLMATSSRTDTHIANGTAWYNYSGWSSGFARAGDQIFLNSADTNTSGSNDQRLSWHWNSSGWRCGSDRGLGSDFERLVFQAGGVNNTNNPYPAALDTFLGENMKGRWSLTAEDADVGPIVREGVLNTWALRVKEIVTNEVGVRNPITLNELYPGREYSCTVAPVTKLGVGQRSDAYTFSTATYAPAKPTITRSATDENTITLYFTAGDDGGQPITSYRATCNDGEDDVVMESQGSPITVTGLRYDVPYTCSVAAINGVGVGESSASTAPITPEELPMGLPIWLLYEATRP